MTKNALSLILMMMALSTKSWSGTAINQRPEVMTSVGCNGAFIETNWRAGIRTQSSQDKPNKKMEGKKETITCLEVDDIESYQVIEKNLVAFTLKTKETLHVRVIEGCPDLGFHDYVGYVPMNGRLCVGSESLITREGFNCRIIGIKTAPTIPNLAKAGQPER